MRLLIHYFIRIHAMKNRWLNRGSIFYSLFEQAKRADFKYTNDLVFFAILSGKNPFKDPRRPK